MNYTLRALHPEIDLEHFRTAYNWRTARRLERGSPVIPFEEFASAKPDEISFGLFNGELLAVYLLQQRGVAFQVHFAGKRHAPKEVLLSGAITLRNRLFEQGASEIYGYLLPEHARPNHPLCRFAQAAGLFYCGETIHTGRMGDREIVMMKFSVRR